MSGAQGITLPLGPSKLPNEGASCCSKAGMAGPPRQQPGGSRALPRQISSVCICFCSKDKEANWVSISLPLVEILELYSNHVMSCLDSLVIET